MTITQSELIGDFSANPYILYTATVECNEGLQFQEAEFANAGATLVFACEYPGKWNFTNPPTCGGNQYSVALGARYMYNRC
jgi:hypothetical protein